MIYLYIYIYVYPHEYLIKFPFSMVSISYSFHLISTNHDIPELLTMAHTVFTRSHSCDQTLGQLGIVSGSPQYSTAPIGAAFFHRVGLLLALLHQVTPILTSIPCMIFHLPGVCPRNMLPLNRWIIIFPVPLWGILSHLQTDKRKKNKLKQRRGTSADAAEEGVQRLPRS